jgi:membrane fusion protein (multidrug efflux system)
MKYDLTNTDDPITRRRLLFTILGVVVLVGVIIFALYWFLYAQYFESTDDAYVGGNIVSITNREAGTVLVLHADNTQSVRRGQLLVELDPASADVAMQAAEANLARMVRQVRGNDAKASSGRAQLASARAQLAQAESNYRRRASAGNAVSGEELSNAHDAVTVAKAAVSTAQGGLDQALSQVEGASVANNPDVLAAIAQLRAAAIVEGHLRLSSPVDGVIAQRTVQIGQQLAPGTPLMAVVPLSDVWIDANFKEGQLERMRVGQPVTVGTDIYGSGVTFHGKVAGLGAGSGSAFALLPPQNASGNWIKIVQRVPVRIALDPNEVSNHPLRVGLSVAAIVDVRDTSGALVSSRIGTTTVQGEPGNTGGPAVDALIARIIAANSGRASYP